jgi:NAD(P)-dependent dehydrogenase (short-subunit alcohol dehydrogenase family)
MIIHNVNNTTVFIIGGSSGIGLGIANALAEANARVIVLSRTPPVDTGQILEWRPLDLSYPEESACQLKRVVTEFGSQVDAVFYSAIYYGPKRRPFLTIAHEDWQQQLNVNLQGLWTCLSILLPALQKNSPGLFVHLSSEVVYNGGPGRVGYAATKAAASNLMRSVAQEDPQERVRLLELLPAKMVDTNGIRKRRPNDFDYTGYMTPQHFKKAALTLLQTRGEGMHGKSWIVDEQGFLSCIDHNIPISQS